MKKWIGDNRFRRLSIGFYSYDPASRFEHADLLIAELRAKRAFVLDPLELADVVVELTGGGSRGVGFVPRDLVTTGHSSAIAASGDNATAPPTAATILEKVDDQGTTRTQIRAADISTRLATNPRRRTRIILFALGLVVALAIVLLVAFS